MTHMRFTPHPEDRETLEGLVDLIVARRRARNVSMRSMAAALGVNHASVWYLERRRPANPQVRTLQAFGEVLDAQLRLTLHDLPALPPDPSEVALLAGGFLGTAMVARLRSIREREGVTRLGIQQEHGWKWSSLAGFENSDREPHLSMLQRYARCLGGRLVPSWEESC